MSKSRPTASELATIRHALHNAYDERVSFSQSGADPQVTERAKRHADEYDRLLQRWFNERPLEIQIASAGGKRVDALKAVTAENSDFVPPKLKGPKL